MSNSLLTKKALAHCLKKRMEHIPLNKITVKQLVDDCGLNRQTFYYHFHDIFELLGWIYQKEAVDGIAEYRGYGTWTDGFYKIFLYIEDNRAFCLNTLESLGRNHLDAYLYAVTNDLIMGVINELAAGMRVNEDDKQFIANFYTLAFTGLLIQWMRDGMKESPKLIIERLSVLLEGHFMKALNKYEKQLS
ncbi:TetR-like C-terminal domain-containing protein [Paenibacillus apii]|uniref:TetR-like C-terminal domain-containing protein n=1 Tax=Paenibacillus apii TaxID=1850370 RepID=UPI00143CB9BA|nr:TetR-like C-terminal domain-containing protein [Paenibacillus apii]NJJ39716.1 dihydroxyacetone kinase transcriptional activator DhaS [Paenibacillus apii]